MHDRYAVDHDFLSPEVGDEVLTISRLINAFFRWEFNSCETLVRGDRRAPDRLRQRLARRRGHEPALLLPVGDERAAEVVRVLRRHRPRAAARPRHPPLLRDRRPRGPLLRRRSSPRYRALADEYFEVDRYRDFCDSRLPHVDELVLEWISSAEFDRAARATPSARPTRRTSTSASSGTSAASSASGSASAARRRRCRSRSRLAGVIGEHPLDHAPLDRAALGVAVEGDERLPQRPAAAARPGAGIDAERGAEGVPARAGQQGPGDHDVAGGVADAGACRSRSPPPAGRPAAAGCPPRRRRGTRRDRCPRWRPPRRPRPVAPRRRRSRRPAPRSRRCVSSA